MATSRLCSIPGCGKPHKAYGRCMTHHSRWRRGTPLLAPVRPQGDHPNSPQNFFLKALTYDGDECLTWPFASNGKGYGKINYGGRSRLVHRAVCEAIYGAPPVPSQEAAHSCGNGHLGCIAKKHLRWASHAENRDDMVEHGRSLKGVKNPGAKLTPEDVLEMRTLRGTVTQRELGRRYGLTRAYVSQILSGKRWGWLD